MRISPIRNLLLAAAISIALWLAFAQFVVPPMLEQAYRGESLSVLNDLIRGRDAHPVAHYLAAWNRIATGILLAVVALWLVAVVIAWERRAGQAFIGEATPGTLGAIRMWTCLTLLIAISLEDMASIALLPLDMQQNIGVMQYFYALPGFQRFITSEAALRAFQWLTELMLFLGVMGLLSRLVIPLAALCHLVLLGLLVDYSFFWHQNLVPLHLLAVLSFTPCGDGWSLDRLIRIYQGRSVPDANRAVPVYSWSRYACWVVIALPYVENGLAKLRDGGLFWWNSTNMRSILYYDTLTPREFDWAFALYLTSAPDIVFALLGLSALVAEVSYGMVLFSRTARWVLPLVALGMHLSILLLQRILFIDLMLLQFIFFDWRKIRELVGRWVAQARGRIHILYDGSCPLCRRTARLLSSLDLLERLELYDFRTLDLADYNQRLGLSLASSDLEKEMYVISRQRVYRGFHGYRAIAPSLPAFWPLAPWLFVPGISSLGAWIYGIVARNRLKLLECDDSHCATEPAPTSTPDAVSTRVGPGRWLRYPLAVSGIAAVSLLCWFFRVEFYPLTAWHLYSWSDNSGTVTYLKVSARYESGVVARARIEDAVGALAFDGRYSRAIEKCFLQEPEVEFCKKFLTAAGAAYNRKARPGERIDQYYIEKWSWDFRSHPSDPSYGNLSKRFIFEVRN